jgi:phosphatidylglycerophosphate synthase
VTEQKYSYAASVKSNVSDELINTYLIRPLAGFFVRIAFHTPLTPNQVTILSTLVGCFAALLYFDELETHTMIAGACITLKDVLDSADGQLARARQQYSRMGRFLDSLGDVLVNMLVFGAITFALVRTAHSFDIIGVGAIAFVGLTLRVSYHVFYQTSFLHLQDSYNVNRTTEEIQSEDLKQGKQTLQLQRLFQFIYGWQDRLMVRIDSWCRVGLERSQPVDALWYGNTTALRISGFMGLGTELFLLTLFSLFNRLELYLYVNVIVLNAVWVTSIVYRRNALRRSIARVSFRSRSGDSP